MISLFPDARLSKVLDRAVALNSVVDPAEFMVYLFVFNELPLLLKSSEVRICLLSVFFVHQQQRVQSFKHRTGSLAADLDSA